ncbi:MAG: exosortase system-associated protein, TIGR04073 family [Mariprofundaceae bacterium]
MTTINKIKTVAAVFALVMVSSPVFADDYGSQAGDKFSRGLANAATGWVEVPKNIANESNKSNVLVGLTVGSVKGVAHTVGRTAVGAVELGTFFIPSEQVVHAKYVWQESDQDTTYRNIGG